jgi:type VI secretion system protein ImpA
MGRGEATVLDLDPWLSPLNGEGPSGTSLRDDPRFHEIERLLDVRRDDTGKPVEAVDWSQVMARAEALRPEGRDLRLLVIVARAQTSERGLAGLTDGLNLITRTIESHWGSLHPELRDAATPRDAARRRIGALMELEGPRDSALEDLHRRTLFDARGLGPVTGYDLERAAIDSRTALNEPPRPGIGEKERARLVADHEEQVARVRAACAAVADQSPDVYAALRAEAEAALDALAALQAALASRAGDFPFLPDLQKSLGRMKTSLSHPSAVTAEAPAAASPNPHADTPPVASAAPAGLPSRLSSREDVIACLDRIIDFYDRTEPASPVPYLARRMRRMVPMDFIELMEDLAPSGLKEFRALAGLEDDRKGSARTQGEKT